MNMKKITILAMLFWLATGCYKEETLTRSAGPENVYSEYTLPQGNHPYDTYIREFFDTYGTLILYKYEDQDIYWNRDRSIGPFRWDAGNPTLSTQGYYYSLADEEYIDEQLELIRDKFFKHFSRQEVLKKLLPIKIFLADTFGTQALTWSGNTPTGKGAFYATSAYLGIDYMLFTWGGPRIATMTAAQKNTYKYEVFNAFFTKMTALNKLVPPAAFSATTDYSNAWPPAASKPGLGIMPNQNGSLTSTTDWNAYVTVILRTPYDQLIAQPTLSGTGLPSTSDFTGYLHPDIDVNGKLREKYEIILAYFTETFGIDLQGIGNDLEE
jgi:hypothetical protein